MNKLVRACIALAAFAAFAVLPSAASAQNDLTLLKGDHATVLPVGSKVIATSNGNTFSRLKDAPGAGETLVQCQTTSLTGELLKNDHNAVQGTISAASFVGTPSPSVTHAGHCFGSSGPTHVNANPTTNGLHWCLNSTAASATHSFTVRGGACTAAARPIRFTVDITSALGTIHCEFQRTAAISGTYTTGTTPTLKVTDQEFHNVSVFSACPTRAWLDLEQQLHTYTTKHANGEVTTESLVSKDAT